MIYDPAYVELLSSRLRAALDEALALMDDSALRSEVEELLQHARGMHELIREQLDVAFPVDHVALQAHAWCLREAIDWVAAIHALTPNEVFWPHDL